MIQLARQLRSRDISVGVGQLAYEGDEWHVSASAPDDFIVTVWQDLYQE